LQIGGSRNITNTEDFTFILGDNKLYSPGAKSALQICGKKFEFADCMDQDRNEWRHDSGGQQGADGR
jgi:hypothetical protein